MEVELDNVYSTLGEMKEDIDNIALAKKKNEIISNNKIISFIYFTDQIC